MFKDFINIRYNFQLIRNMLDATLTGVLVLNLIAPLAIVYIQYGSISNEILGIWFCMHLILFSLRILAQQKMYVLINANDEKAYSFIRYIYLLSFIATLLYGYMIWFTVLHGVSNLSIFIITVMIFGLTAGSITTIGSIYTAYIIFVVPNYIFLISASLYHGGKAFNLFALTMFVMMLVLIVNGRRYYILLRDAISTEETFRTIYENSSDGVVLFQNRKLINLNKAILKMFKAPSEEEMLHFVVSQLSPPYQPDGVKSVRKMLKVFNEAMETGFATTEWLHIDYEGKEFWCDIVLTKIHLHGEDLVHGVWRDISHKKEFELSMLEHKEEIEQLNKTLEERVNVEVQKNMLKDRQMLQQSRLAQMGEMISMIAHQWRQPLAAIASASSAINLKAQLGNLDKETAIQTSNDIAEYTQHLSSTIDDFRDFFKQDKQKEPTNYTYIISSVLNIMKASLGTKNIQVIEDLECNESFMTYSNELKQVVINIMKNAQDILVEKKIQEPYIKVKIYHQDEKYIIEISDNGRGIKDDVMDKIFDPYFSTKLQKDGTGLGLYMSKIIIDEHCKGKLSCFNTDDGVCFRIEL